MQTLSKLDLPARLAPVLPVWAGEVITAFVCVAGAGVVRFGLDALVPGLAPFVLLFPAALIATLVGGWRPGLATLAVCEFAAWCYVVPPQGLAFKGEAQPEALLAVLASGLVVVAAAELFRAGARRQDIDRSAKLAERDLMMLELEHRMRNNFQTVASLLELQLRRAADEPAKAALRAALSRVVGISNAHRNLYAPGDDLRAVDMGVYLKDLCASLAEALFLGEVVRLECRAEGGALDRDRAVAVGLIVNELVTNAAKHAFADGRPGHINVAFARAGHGYRLVVEDDGRGLPEDFSSRRHGLGRGLVEAFTRQAGGHLTVGGGAGARFEVELPA